MKTQEQWTAFIDDQGKHIVTKVTESYGLPENHYDYEEPILLPPESIKVIAMNDSDPMWRDKFKLYLEANHPEIASYQILKVPRDPWNDRRLVDDPVAILKANLEVKPGGPPEVGNVIDGTFQVEKRLGAGAAGTAFEVSLTRDWGGHRQRQRLCLKWYDDRIFNREAEAIAIARRVRESRFGGALNHPNLVRIYDVSEFWKEQKPRYLLMELIQGQTVEDLVRHKKVASDEALHIIIDIANGLKTLHDASIMHRDVKAANVMVDSQGRAVLLDLGVVSPASEATIAGSQEFIGSLRFAAPEWLFRESYSAASDVYSLGTIAYLLLANRPIFSDIRLFTRLTEAARKQVPELPTIHTDMRSEYLCNLTRRMLAKSPSERPALDEIIGLLTDESRFEVWRLLREGEVFDRLPNHYHNDGPSQREFVQAVLDNFSMDELMEIREHSAFDRITANICIRRFLNLLSHQETVNDYLSQSPDLRISYVKNLLARIDQDQAMSWGDQVEASHYLVASIYQAERLSEIRRELEPLVSETDAAMNMLIEDMKQANP